MTVLFLVVLVLVLLVLILQVPLNCCFFEVFSAIS